MSERTAILAANRHCIDARLDPAGFAGIKEGDAHVIRNAGGRASDDAIRSLLSSSLETAVLGADGFTDVGEGPGSSAGESINWLTISDLRQSVIDDVRRIREHPLVPARISIHGFIYQVETGELVAVEEASAKGA